MSGLVDNIRASLLGLKMPRAMEMLDHMVQRLEKGEIGAIEAIDSLLSEEFNCREDRRVGVALTTALPEHVRANAPITPPPAPKRRCRPPKKEKLIATTG